MGFDLSPRNKSLDWFHMGAFSWSWMLDAGVGLCIGCGPAKDPGRFRYVEDKKGRCPRHNDGFRVTAEQARAMSWAAWGLASVERGVREEWDALDEKTRAEHEKWNQERRLFKSPVRDDFIEKAEEFAAWAEKSWGFSIH